MIWTIIELVIIVFVVRWISKKLWDAYTDRLDEREERRSRGYREPHHKYRR